MQPPNMIFLLCASLFGNSPPKEILPKVSLRGPTDKILNPIEAFATLKRFKGQELLGGKGQSVPIRTPDLSKSNKATSLSLARMPMIGKLEGGKVGLREWIC